MTYTAGTFVPYVGRHDTLANLLLFRTPANQPVGCFALVDDGGWYWNDGTQWRPMGVGGAAAQQIVTSGATSTVSSGVHNVFLDGAATTHTITFPVPVGDGQELYINATQAISVALTLTVTAPGTVIKNAPATLAAGVGIGFQYHLATTTWYRLF